jgi:hypothetical protein
MENTATKSRVNQTGRVAFTTSRALEFFSESELTTQIGYRRELWPLVLVKELFDNGIDDCESGMRAIEISVGWKNSSG